MPNSEMNPSNPSRRDDQSRKPAQIAQDELDRIADEAARKAQKEEQAYDADNGIFTK